MPDNTYYCDKCNRNYTSKKGLNIHYKSNIHINGKIIHVC